MSFSANKGQAEEHVKFLSQGPGYKLILSSAGAALTLSSLPRGRSSSAASSAAEVPFKMRLNGANRKTRAEGLEELPGKNNYFIGRDPKRWRTNVPTYARVKYGDVYPGVDLIYYGNQQHLEYDLVLAPHTDPSRINLSFDGAEKVELAPNGDLLVTTGGIEFRQLKPIVFQEGDRGMREPAECHYVLKSTCEVSFALGPYDAARALVIDPVLDYSTTGIGGNSIAVDSAGNVYLTGRPSIQGTPGVFQATPQGGEDAFVAKLNSTGTQLIYATNLGGTGDDEGTDLAVDAEGNVYVVGITRSADFPVTAGAFQSTYGGNVCGTNYPHPCADVFIAKLNASGSRLIYASYLGGSAEEFGGRVRVDSSGNAYITGSTESSTFPVTEGAYQTIYAGNRDAFVTKVNPTGTDLIYSTFLGTSGWQTGADIALDATGEVFVAGNTEYGFPTTPGAFTTAYGIHFVTKLNATGTAPIYSSCFTVSFWQEFDFVTGIEVDSSGNAYLVGTYTKEVPGFAFPSPFVQKLNQTGSVVEYFMSLGDMGWGYGIAVDPFGYVCVTGETRGGLLVTGDALQKEIGGGRCFGYPCADAFIARLSPSGTLLYSTYLGGNGIDEGFSVAVDPTGGMLVTGYACSSDFLTTSDSYRSSAGVGSFLLRFAPEASSVSAAHYNISPVAQSAIVAAFGPALGSGTEAASSIPLPVSLAGSQVVIRDSAGIDYPAPVYYVSPTQINYEIPAGASLGPALVTVSNGNGHLSTGLVTITSVAPALFTLNQIGSGAAAALDGFTFTGAPFAATRPDGQPNIVALFGTGLGADATDRDPGFNVSSSVDVTIDGIPASTVFVGSAPGFTGLNQINVVLPIGLSPGTHTVVVSRHGVKSNLVTITIR